MKTKSKSKSKPKLLTFGLIKQIERAVGGTVRIVCVTNIGSNDAGGPRYVWLIEQRTAYRIMSSFVERPLSTWCELTCPRDHDKAYHFAFREFTKQID